MKSKEIDINGIVYTVFENGDVYNGESKITQRPNYKDGYACFTAGKKGNRVSVKTHSVVGKLFVDNPNDLPELDHLDGNRMNPSASNLEWVTHQENIRRAYERGGHLGRAVGTKNPRAGLYDELVLLMRKLYKNGTTIQEMVEKYGYPWTTISNAVKGVTWRHLPI